jgi:hypothetical protein
MLLLTRNEETSKDLLVNISMGISAPLDKPFNGRADASKTRTVTVTTEVPRPSDPQATAYSLGRCCEG